MIQEAANPSFSTMVPFAPEPPQDATASSGPCSPTSPESCDQDQKPLVEPVPSPSWMKGAYWDKPVLSEGCTAYGTREHTARLWGLPFYVNWKNACQQTDLDIPGQSYGKPDYCETQVSTQLLR